MKLIRTPLAPHIPLDYMTSRQTPPAPFMHKTVYNLKTNFPTRIAFSWFMSAPIFIVIHHDIFRDFVASNWCRHEFEIAFHKNKDIPEKSRFLILILLEDIPQEIIKEHNCKDLQTYLNTHTYIDARKYTPYDIDKLRKRIRFAMPDTPLEKLKKTQKANSDDVEGNVQQEDQKNVRVEATKKILRLLEADGTVRKFRYEKKEHYEDFDEESNVDPQDQVTCTSKVGNINVIKG